MDRIVAGAIITGICAGAIALSCAVFWALDLALDIIHHLRTNRSNP